MLANITLFEFRYQLRRPIALVSFLVFGLLAFGLSAAAGAYAVACLAFLGVVFGHAIGGLMPWVSAASAGPFRPEAYAVVILTMGMPNVFSSGALFCAV